MIAPAPEPTVTGAGPVGLSLAVDTVLMHYQDHLPFHRLTGIFLREGMSIDRSTLSRVSGRVADLLAPLVDHMESVLLGGENVIGIDGTGLKIFASPHCERRLAYVIHGQGAVVFRMLTGESADQVLEGFEDFHGVVVSDAAKVHLGRHSRSLGLVIALCNAHARRKFYDARETDRARADRAIAFYREVAMHERAWSKLEAPARQKERAAHLRPLFEKYHQWLLEERSRVMPRTPMREAIDYSLNHWSGLTHFLHDGRVPWTNNESERHLRHIVVGRKNFVFRGSFEGAERACVLWSLMMSCRVNGVNPREYLLATLEALRTATRADLATLTPRAYAERRKTIEVATAA